MIVWDGGNNDTPFVKPNVHVVVVDPHRPGHELRYHPGETNLRMADVCVVNKVDSAPPEGVDAVLESIREHNPAARIVLAASPFVVEGDAAEITGKRVLAIEDGPTLTHGEMTYGAAVLAAQMDDLRATIEACNAELVLIGTPIDLRRLIDFEVPALRITYRLQEVGEPTLADVLREVGLTGGLASSAGEPSQPAEPASGPASTR